jgi:hypothetical protein
MGVIPTASATGSVDCAGRPATFWQRIARLLDQLVVNRTKRAVPAIALRRSDRDIRRCRQLMPDYSDDRAAPAAWPRAW